MSSTGKAEMSHLTKPEMRCRKNAVTFARPHPAFSLFSSFYVVFFFSTIATSFGLSWTNCGGDKIKFRTLALTPEPLRFGSQASVSGEFEVLSSISALSSSSELQKKVLFLWPDQLKNCPNHIGTCQKQDLCALLTKFSALCKNGLPCRCPIAPKTYKFQTTFTAPKNSYGYLATGQFYYKINFEENGAQVGCFDVYFDMEDWINFGGNHMM